MNRILTRRRQRCAGWGLPALAGESEAEAPAESRRTNQARQ